MSKPGKPRTILALILEATLATASRCRPCAIQERNPFAMPQTSTQGLCFVLGLLLAFYILAPFLELTVR